MAQLGYNLMRIHHHDSEWVYAQYLRHARPAAVDAWTLSPSTCLDWWIKCLKDEGIYVWLDMHVGRMIKPEDGLTDGAQEVAQGQGLDECLQLLQHPVAGPDEGPPATTT